MANGAGEPAGLYCIALFLSLCFVTDEIYDSWKTISYAVDLVEGGL